VYAILTVVRTVELVPCFNYKFLSTSYKPVLCKEMRNVNIYNLWKGKSFADLLELFLSGLSFLLNF
jgi:hypothetical protein